MPIVRIARYPSPAAAENYADVTKNGFKVRRTQPRASDVSCRYWVF